MTKCKFCSKEFKTNSGNGLHEIQCKQNPNARSPQKGRIAWNKGLTKEDNPIIQKHSDTLVNNYKTGKSAVAGCAAWDRSTKSMHAIKMGFGGYNVNAGRSKKFRVTDSYGKEVVLQSTYELRCSEILNSLKIKWIRPKHLPYDSKKYFPDFYLTEYDIYLDPKNAFKAKQDQDKIQKVIDQNAVRVYIVLEENLNTEWFCNLVGKIGD